MKRRRSPRLRTARTSTALWYAMRYRSAVRSSEWIAFAYFLYVGAFAWIRPLPPARRVALTAACAFGAGAVWAIAHIDGAAVLRDWAPAAYILGGYYASGHLFVAPSLPVEAWLMSWDRRLLGDPATRFAHWPRVVVGVLELVYLGCFVAIGAGFLILSAAGHASYANRYWTMVSAAELGSFAPLAFIQTRPPWALERKPVLADRAIHDLASEMTDRFTIRVNTFPSGHVAGSLAVALAVGSVLPAIGAAFLLLALAIAVACVVGRYHYIIDAVAGALLAIVICAIVLVVS